MSYFSLPLISLFLLASASDAASFADSAISDVSRMSDFSDEAKIRRRVIRPFHEDPWTSLGPHPHPCADIPAQHAAKYPEHAARTRVPTFPPLYQGLPGPEGILRVEPGSEPVFLRPFSEQHWQTAPQTTIQRLPSSHPSESTTQPKAKCMKLSENKWKISVPETMSSPVTITKVVVDAEGKQVPLTGLLHPTTSSSNPEEPGGSAKKD